MLPKTFPSKCFIKCFMVMFTIPILHINHETQNIGVVAEANSTPNALPQLTQVQVDQWLKNNLGTQHFKMNFRDEKISMHGLSWIETSKDQQGVIHIWHGSHGYVNQGRPSDHYEVVHKTFQSTPPFKLLSADFYLLNEGKAQALSWRSTQGGKGKWIARSSADELRRIDRKNEREGAELASKLWRSPHHSSQVHTYESQETLATHIGLTVFPRLQEISLSSLQLLSEDQIQIKDNSYTLRRVGQRLHKLSGVWTFIQEIKVIDAQGRVTYDLQDLQGRTLHTHLSDKHSVTAQFQEETPQRLSTLLRKSEKLRATDRAPWAKYLRSKLDQCQQKLPKDLLNRSKENFLKLSLLFDQNQGLKIVSFNQDVSWLPYYKCVTIFLDQAPQNLIRTSKSGADLSFSIELSL